MSSCGRTNYSATRDCSFRAMGQPRPALLLKSSRFCLLFYAKAEVVAAIQSLHGASKNVRRKRSVSPHPPEDRFPTHAAARLLLREELVKTQERRGRGVQRKRTRSTWADHERCSVHGSPGHEKRQTLRVGCLREG